MSRQLEAERETRRRALDLRIVSAAEGGLEAAVERAGGELRGLSVKFSGVDVLVTLKAEFSAGKQVAFVGADTLAGALVKGCQEARADRLRWRADKYG